MFGQMPAQRAIAVAGVILLHILLIWLLLRATELHITLPPVIEQSPITIFLPTTPKPTKPVPKPKVKEKAKKPKKVPAVPPVKHAAGIPQPAAPSAPAPAEPFNGLRALGRYLNNCSSGNYQALSALDWAHCLGNIWPAPGERPLLLGAEPPSIWKTQKQRQKAPSKPFEHICDSSAPNANLGLPCYSFGK